MGGVMDERENALRIIRFGSPERVVESPPWRFVRYFGCEHEGFEGGGPDMPVGSRWKDIWGTGWRRELESIMGFPGEYPPADVGALRDYQWPDPNDERLCSEVYRVAERERREGVFLMGSHREVLWEKAYMLVGMENLMVYFRTEPGFVREVLRRVMDFQLGMAEHYLKVGVEFVAPNDDMGAQTGPLLGPDIVDEFLMPEYERLFEVYRKGGVMIRFHSCGNVEWMLERFMKLGVDVLHPVQATANDLTRVREATQGRMALEGGVSTVTIMKGPAEAIEREVRERLWQLGREGGYFCAADQCLPFPEEHIGALRKAVGKYGRYPLERPEW